MKSFSQYHLSLNEARSRGEAMEEVIVAAVNGKPMSDEKWGINAEAGKRVAKFLKNNSVTGKAKVLGAETIDVSKKWSEYWGGSVPAGTKTPKTDFIVGSAKISLKSGDAAQLMSGGKNESVATFYTALEKTQSDMPDKMVKKLKGMFEGLAPSSVAAGDLRAVIKSKKDEVVNKANAAHKALMGELRSIFEENEKFRDAFAYEAMSGEVKFGKNDGTCTHFLVTEFDGSKSSLHSVKDKKYVSKIAEQMKVSVRFKTTSVKTKSSGKTGEYRYWSVVGLIIDKMQEDVDVMLQGKSELNENVITDFFRKVKDKIVEFFMRAIEYVRKGIRNLFEFLEVEPDVSFNNNIRF